MLGPRRAWTGVIISHGGTAPYSVGLHTALPLSPVCTVVNSGDAGGDPIFGKPSQNTSFDTLSLKWGTSHLILQQKT